ncbi:MAG: response regulator [Bdellovibrionales bacterium]|nr:response regulator [Bdellovibrionales bacterium]
MSDFKSQRKPTVLIVDDVAFVRATLSKILTDNGYDVVSEASSGTEAIEQYGRLSPDLVTMDVVMPKMSGIEATRKIMKAHPGARIVMISAMGQESLVMEAIHAGARDYLLKPFSSEEIVKTLSHVLQDRSLNAHGAHAAGA